MPTRPGQSLIPSVDDLLRYRAALQDARFSGVRTVRDSNGEEVTYRSQSEIELAITRLDAEIAQLQRGRSSLIRMQTSKGIH